MVNKVYDKAASGMLPGEPVQGVERRAMSNTITPFQEEAAVENYFAGKPSEELWQQLRAVFTAESTLMIVTGEAGVGKTMFCKKIARESELPASVFFFEVVGSFGDVIAKIADAFFGIALEAELTGDAQISGLCDALQQKGEPVLLVFDQAEELYLATLERIRRLYDSLCKAGVPAYVLFIGRPQFLDNYKQLVICNFDEARERFFSLQQLSETETERYLQSAAARCREAEMGLFSRPEVLQGLYQVSSGNYRTINAAVRKGLSQSQEPAAFIKALQYTDETEPQKQPGLFARLRGVLRSRFLMLRQFCSGLYDRWWLQQSGQQKKIILFVLCGFLLVSGLAFLFPLGDGATDDNEQEISSNEPVSESPAIEAEQQQQPRNIPPTGQVTVAPIVISGEKSVSGNTSPVGSVGESRQAAEKKDPAAIAGERGLVEEQVEAAGKEEVPPVFTSATGRKKVLIEQEDTPSQPEDESTPIVIQAVSHKQGMPAVEEEQEIEEEVPPPVIRPSRRKVRFQRIMDSLEDSASLAQISSQEEGEIVLLRPLESSKYKNSIKGRSLASGRVIGSVTERERLVQNRFVAGMGWRNANKGSLYTVKIAQLAGAQAERLDEIFTARRFRPLVTDLYLFSKGLSPEYIIVFYGEFARKEDAEKALADISAKFPEYRPSLMTIKEAMRNVRR